MIMRVKSIFFKPLTCLIADILYHLPFEVKQKSKIMQVPELLAPAGNLEKLKVAVSYGASAVYVGGLKFGLRSAADNFTNEELGEGVQFAHERGSLVYVVLNGFLHDKDLAELVEFIEYLDVIKIDAVIVSDLGVIETVKNHTNLEVHLSTQASCLNSYSAKLWKKMGVSRIVLGREVSIAEAKIIKEKAEVEIEMFIHGSMCMAYSGNCVISNFTQGRDSNRGGCAHSCRFEYSIATDQESESEKKRQYFMSSKDLNGLSVLEDFILAGIDSVKVEGRMKSHLYAATMSKIYSEAIDYYKENKNFLSDKVYEWEEELNKVTHRSYAPNNLIEKAKDESIFNEREFDDEDQYVMLGRLMDVKENEFLVIQVRNAFEVGDELEVLPFEGSFIKIKINEMTDLIGNPITRTKPTTLVKIPYVIGCEKNNILRKVAHS